MNFGRDSQTENWLNQRGVSFVYREAVRFTDLVPNWEVINQGRPDGIPKEEATIEKYAGSMNNGSIFPAVILAPAADGLEVLDGIQRLMAAFLNDHAVFNAYIVDSQNPSIRASIRICANSVLNGSTPSLEWTIGRVVDVLYEQHRWSDTDCSLWSGVPLKKIQAEVQSRDGALWMEAHGIDMNIKPANQRGFQAKFASKFSVVEREKLAPVLPDIIRAIQGVKATNNEADLLLDEATDFKPQKGVPLHVQLRDKFDEVFNRPEIKGRMMGRRRLHPIEEIMRSLASTITITKKAASKNHHTDEEQSERLVEFVMELREEVRKIVPKDQWGPLGFGPRRD